MHFLCFDFFGISNPNDIVVFMRDWLNKEKLSMELLSSDENFGCISEDSGRAPFDGTACP